MIQDVISRMASNSLQIKCWTMAIVGVMITFSSGDLILTAIVPAVLFCCLDAKYLSLEKAYRGLYDDIRRKEESAIDFSMDVTKIPIKFGLRSWSVWPFYLTICLIVILITVLRW